MAVLELAEPPDLKYAEATVIPTPPTRPAFETATLAGRTYGYLVRREFHPAATTFPTDAGVNLQVGFVVYPRGGEVARHVHLPIPRSIVGTAEVLLVKEGRCLLDLYDDERRLVVTWELSGGDLVLLVAGGHGVRMLEDTILIEVKQGPYTGLKEKERF